MAVVLAVLLIVLATGVELLIVGHKSGFWFTVHKVSFIVWGVVFGVHFLAHLPRVVGSLRTDWTRKGRERIPGAGIRALLVSAALGGGAALAIVVLPQITSWHVGRPSRRSSVEGGPSACYETSTRSTFGT